MKKGIIYVMFANIVCLFLSVITNFILPKFLSVETYALIKTYTLYIMYAGFFSLGYNDGMYLKYGGKEISEISREDIGNNVINYSVLEIIMVIIVLLAGAILNDLIMIAFAVGMFSANMLGYIKSLYQATGEFKLYSYVLNIEKLSLFVMTIVMIFLFKIDNYILYIWMQALTGFIIMCWLLWKLEKKYNFIKFGRIKLNEFVENIGNGFILMLGNFSSNIFTGLDRWFIKILMDSMSFAVYSFAVSLENALNVFMVPITVAMYNYFCKVISQKEIIRVKRMVLIWGFFIISAAFPVKWILEVFLTQYIDSNNIVFLLFAAQAFYVIIKGIYVNVYKVKHRQKKYLLQMLIMIAVAFLLNIMLYFVYKSMIGIALATFFTSIIWFLVCEKGMPEIRYSFKEYVSIVIMIVAYFACGFYLSAIVGMVVYLVVGLVVLLIFLKDTFFDLLNIIKSFIDTKKHKISDVN